MVSGPEGSVGERRLPGRKGGDITRIQVTADDTVGVELSMRELPSSDNWTASFEIASSANQFSVIVANAEGEAVSGLFADDPKGRGSIQQDCPDLSTSLAGDDQAIVVAVPSVCLESPQWVRISVVIQVDDDALSARDEAPAGISPQISVG